MPYETKDMTGALFANKDRKSDTHPNAKGSALIDGVEFFVDAWTNTDRNGNKYQSLKFKRKEQRREEPPTSYGDPADELDDSVPF